VLGEDLDAEENMKRIYHHRVAGCRAIRCAGLLAAALVFAGFPGITLASSVLQMGLKQIVTSAELVFEGRVLASEVRAVPGQRFVFTFVKFQVLDVIKGKDPGPTIELPFLGGRVGNQTLAVSDMHMPEVGEHGIYMVSSTGGLRVNPLYGWDQGHFIVKTDQADGSARMFTRDGHALTGFVPEQADVAAGLSRGYPRGLVAQKQSEGAAAMTVDQFKQGLRRMIGVTP
jgi:hypothetical protein